MLAVYNQSLASIGTRPSHMEEGLVTIQTGCTYYITTSSSTSEHLVSRLIICMKLCVHKNLYPQNVWYVIVAYRYRLLRAPTSYMCAHTLQVKVCHVSNATRLWVSLLQHSPRHRGEKPVPCHDPFVFVKLTMDLAQFYSSPENKRLHG